MIPCIRAIIFSSIRCPPTVTSANLQNHFSCVQQKMWDMISLCQGGEFFQKPAQMSKLQSLPEETAVKPVDLFIASSISSVQPVCKQ